MIHGTDNKKRILKRGAAFLCAAALCGTISGCRGAEKPVAPNSSFAQIAKAEEPVEKTYKTDEERWEAERNKVIPENFKTAYEKFTYETAEEILKNSGENRLYSPLSLYYALALAAEGAEGETREEILSVLHYPYVENLSADCKAAYEVFYHGETNGETKNSGGESNEENPSSRYQLKISNSLWADSEAGLKKTYADHVSRHFYADVFQVDFKDEKTKEHMADWVEERTNGLIRPEMKLSGEEILSIINTVYFYDEWVNRFDKEQTEPGIFTRGDGKEVTCDFMNMEMGSHGFIRGENYTSSSLSLKNGTVDFYLPDKGTNVQELMENPEIIKAVLEGKGESGMGEVIWKVPKFSYGTKMDLGDSLKTLGIRKAFEDGDFSNMASSPAFISSVRQETHIGMDENGVEAAAFTEIMYAGAAMPTGRAEMILDRPFLYVIKNRGQILFIGVCEDPSV